MIRQNGFTKSSWTAIECWRRIDGGEVRLFTRNGNDWSHKLPDLVKAMKNMRLKPGWLDGEIVVLNEKGLPDFQALQNAFDNARTQNIVLLIFLMYRSMTDMICGMSR